MFVRPYGSPSVRPCLCHAFLSRSIFEKSANLWQVIGRILDSNLIYNVKIRHPWICDDLVLRTQKVALGPPLPCGCNLVQILKFQSTQVQICIFLHIENLSTTIWESVYYTSRVCLHFFCESFYRQCFKKFCDRESFWWSIIFVVELFQSQKWPADHFSEGSF